jgi:hypothetical protein
MSLSFPDIAPICPHCGADPLGLQPTPSSACLVCMELNSLATGGSRGTRADHRGLPPQFRPDSHPWEN